MYMHIKEEVREDLYVHASRVADSILHACSTGMHVWRRVCMCTTTDDKAVTSLFLEHTLSSMI
jgi:hypothetical protein